jgi:hypothetical protein
LLEAEHSAILLVVLVSPFVRVHHRRSGAEAALTSPHEVLTYRAGRHALQVEEQIIMKIRLIRSAFLSGGLALAGLLVSSATAPARAGTITYVTPPGSTTSGGPVSAEATLVTGSGSVTITLTNLLANPTDVAQNLSDLIFTVGGGGSLTGSTETGATSQEVTVNKDGTFTVGPTLTTVADVGWPYTSTATQGTLNVLSGPGHAGPAHLIIGPPGPGGTYSNANGSIAGNGPHNPFLNQTATFTIMGSGITADTTITSVTFSFGTTTGINVVGQAVPEPSSIVLGLAGLGLVGTISVCRTRRRA